MGFQHLCERIFLLQKTQSSLATLWSKIILNQMFPLFSLLFLLSTPLPLQPSGLQNFYLNILPVKQESPGRRGEGAMETDILLRMSCYLHSQGFMLQIKVWISVLFSLDTFDQQSHEHPPRPPFTTGNMQVKTVSHRQKNETLCQSGHMTVIRTPWVLLCGKNSQTTKNYSL